MYPTTTTTTTTTAVTPRRIRPRLTSINDLQAAGHPLALVDATYHVGPAIRRYDMGKDDKAKQGQRGTARVCRYRVHGRRHRGLVTH